MVLPEVLRNPPWRAATSTEAVPPLHAASKPKRPNVEPPRLCMSQGERALALAGRREPVRGEALARCMEQLLERADARKPLPLSEVAKLDAESLRDLVRDVAPSCWDADLLRLLVDRLGDAGLDDVLRIARSVHPRRTFWALAAVESDALATLAARDFVREREAALDGGDAGDAERWLVRFADHALAGLAGEPSSEAAFARRFLSALYGRFVVTDEAPFACLAQGASDHAQLRRWAIACAHDRASAVFDELRTMEADARLAPFVAFCFARESRSGDAVRARSEAAGAWLKHTPDVLRVLTMSPHSSARFARGFLSGHGTQTETDEMPSSVQPLPSFLARDALAAPCLRDGSELPIEAMEPLLELLRFSNLTRPYVGLREVKDACSAESLDALAASIFRAWLKANAPIRERWCLEVPGKIGGPTSVQLLAEQIRSWGALAQARTTEWDEDAHQVVVTAEGDHAWAYAREGLRVLIAQGSPAALNAVDELARSARSGWLRYEARKLRPEPTQKPMQTKGNAEALPALRAEVGSVYCVGPRSFRLRVSESLEVSLIEEDGRVSTAFPRLRATDDADMYAREKARYTALQAEAKTLAKQQLGELEEAMCAQRAWTAAAFRTHFVEHPLLCFVGRRLVFAYLDEEAGMRSFRIAEDGSFADADDAPLSLPADARVRILHPIAISEEERNKWAMRFAEYEIVQPFEQLKRPVFFAEGVEGYEVRAMRNAGISRGDLFALPKRGWRAKRDGRTTARWERSLAVSHAVVTLQVSPGLTMDTPPTSGQRVVSLRSSTALDRLPEVDFSELLREAERLRKPATEA